jgi:hypothetical protein
VSPWQDVGVLGPALSVTRDVGFDLRHRFEVRAVDSEGNASQASAPLDVLIERPDLPVPKLTASTPPSGGLALSWTSTAGVPYAEFVDRLEVMGMRSGGPWDTLAVFEGADATRAGSLHWDVAPGNYMIILRVSDRRWLAVGSMPATWVSVPEPGSDDEDAADPPVDEPSPPAPNDDIPPSPPPAEDNPGESFGDVPATHTFSDDISWLQRTGITRGCSGDRFCPDQSVTRGQMAAFLRRALGS